MPSSKLFHAVVVMGASLTASCGTTTVVLDAGDEGDAAVIADAGGAEDAGAATDAGGATDAGDPGEELDGMVLIL